MRGVRELYCPCCGLDQIAPAAVGAHRPMARCVSCARHGSDSSEAVAAARADHVRMYQQALAEARDETLLAQGERDLYRRRMQAAHQDRARLVEVFSEITAEHHGDGRRCSCGRRGCKTREILADPQVLPSVRTYDEHQRTMRELRNANPGRWAQEWDYVDINLVYPRSSARPGRHRATG